MKLINHTREILIGIRKDHNYRYFFSIKNRIKNVGFTSLIKEFILYIKKYTTYPRRFGVKKVETKYKLFVVYNYFKIISIHPNISHEDLMNYIPSRLQQYYLFKLDPKDKRVVTFDKILFYKEMQKNNLPFPKVHFFVENKTKYALDGQTIDLQCGSIPTKLFVKPIRDNGGNDSGIIEKEYFANVPNNMLAQEIIVNHNSITQISDNSAFNTLRVITYLDVNDNFNILSAIYRLSLSKQVYNWGKGSINVEVNPETGKLGKFGITKYFEKYYKHPKSELLFEDYQIPMWHQIISVLKQAARAFDYLKFIAWDIGISEKGPIIVEANSGCDLFHAQLFSPYGNNLLFKDLDVIHQ